MSRKSSKKRFIRNAAAGTFVAGVLAGSGYHLARELEDGDEHIYETGTCNGFEGYAPKTDSKPATNHSVAERNVSKISHNPCLKEKPASFTDDKY